MLEQAAALSLRGNDLYQTPPEAVRALLKAESLPRTIWEPACGPGSIARTLRAAGHVVYATDLVDYKSPDQDMSRWDFLNERQAPIGVEAIVTNPPFKNADEFVEHSLKLCPKVYMLLRLSFLEGGTKSKARRAILDGGRLAKVMPFANRLPMMHRDGYEGPKEGSKMVFAWFVWNEAHTGDATIRRLWCEKSRALKPRKEKENAALFQRMNVDETQPMRADR
jgi:hypothetical protein